MTMRTIQTTAGDGELRITVDEFGRFGSSSSSVGQRSFYDPIGPIASASTTFRSYLALGIEGDAISTRSELRPTNTTDFFSNSTSDSTNSSFDAGGLQFQLREGQQKIDPMINQS
jgi:hypothetical protein